VAYTVLSPAGLHFIINKLFRRFIQSLHASSDVLFFNMLQLFPSEFSPAQRYDHLTFSSSDTMWADSFT
jgi:hypothetical protein